MKLLTPMLCVFVLPVVALAQGPPIKSNSPFAAKSSITIAVGGLSCTTAAGGGAFSVQSFSWGASNPTTTFGGDISGGKVSISSLNITKRFDACSPVLFEAVSKATSFNQLTLTQRNSDGDAVLTVVLDKVFVEAWQLSSSTAEGGPAESVSFAAQKFCVTDVPSGNKFCFDVLSGKVI